MSSNYIIAEIVNVLFPLVKEAVADKNIITMGGPDEPLKQAIRKGLPELENIFKKHLNSILFTSEELEAEINKALRDPKTKIDAAIDRARRWEAWGIKEENAKDIIIEANESLALDLKEANNLVEILQEKLDKLELDDYKKQTTTTPPPIPSTITIELAADTKRVLLLSSLVSRSDVTHQNKQTIIKLANKYKSEGINK